MINKANNQLDGKLVKDIEGLKREVRDIKNVQLIGGDNTVVEGSNLFSLANTFANGQTRYYTITYTPTSGLMTIPDLRYSLFVGTALDNNYIIPSGGALSDDQLAYDVQVIPQWGTSSDTLGTRVWSVRITSNTVFGPYTVYFYGKIYTIKSPATGGV